MKVVIKRLASEGFPGCCLQLADHTQRGMKEKAEEKDLKSCSFLLNPLFSLPVCLRLSLKGLRVDMLAYPQLPHTRPSFGGIYHLPTLRVLPSPPPPLFLSLLLQFWDRLVSLCIHNSANLQGHPLHCVHTRVLLPSLTCSANLCSTFRMNF